MTRWTLILTLLLAPAFAIAQEEGQETKKPVAEKKNPIVIIETNHGTIEAELFADAAPKTVANFIGLAEGTQEWTDLKLGEKVKRPFYDGLIFHRVIADFMIQGGCPMGNGTGGPGYKFEDEFNFEKLGLNDEMVIDAEGKTSTYLGADQQFASRYAADKLGITTQEQFKARFQEVLDVLKKTKIVDLLKAKGVKDSTELKTSYRPMRGYLAMANSGPNTNGSQFFINLIDTLWLSGRHTVFGKVVSGMDIVDKIGAVPVAKPGDKPLEDVVIKSIRVKKVEEKAEVTSEQPKDEATPEEK